MALCARVKSWLSRLLLRGPLGEWWLRRQVRRIEERYLEELVRASGQSRTNSAPRPAPKPISVPRRILFIGDIMWEARELVPELEKICPVETLNLRPRLQKAGPDGTPSAVTLACLRERIQAAHAPEPDLIFLYARSELLSEEAFATIRSRWKCPLLGMNLDEKFEFLDYGVFSRRNDHYERWARQFDMNLSNVRAVADWYTDRGLPVYYMAEGYSPKFDAPPPLTPEGGYRHELSFVGSRRSEREAFVERLWRVGIQTETFGNGWGESSRCDDPEAVYRASMMNLGLGYAAPSLTLTTLKARDFECPGAGACYLTTWNWELALHYDIGREILCYRSEEELVELFSYYRRRPEECGRIAQAAWRRCLAEHTWERRFRDFFRRIGGDA